MGIAGGGWAVPCARGSDSGASLSACSSQELTCCAGWRQQGDECGIGEWVIWDRARGAGGHGEQEASAAAGLGTPRPVSSAAVCEGNSTCSENEVCVRPGECRCRHGYFGANCDTSERGSQRARGGGGRAQRGRGLGWRRVLSGRGAGWEASRLSRQRLGSPPSPLLLQSARASSGVPTARSCASATRTGSART